MDGMDRPWLAKMQNLSQPADRTAGLHIQTGMSSVQGRPCSQELAQKTVQAIATFGKLWGKGHGVMGEDEVGLPGQGTVNAFQGGVQGQGKALNLILGSSDLHAALIPTGCQTGICSLFNP